MKKRALLVIDVQNEYFYGKLPVVFPEGSISNIQKAIEFANESGITVIFIQHTALRETSETFKRNSEEWQLNSSISNLRNNTLIQKNFPGSFTGTNLEEYLRENNIDTVVISGYMTQMCCDTTARQAFHLGFSVEFLSDATATLDVTNTAGEIKAEELHNAVLIIQQMMFSDVISTEQWISRIKNDNA